MKLPRIANAMDYTNLPKGKPIRSISTYRVGDGTITSYVDHCILWYSAVHYGTNNREHRDTTTLE